MVTLLIQLPLVLRMFHMRKQTFELFLSKNLKFMFM
jgi:hypothetical protein